MRISRTMINACLLANEFNSLLPADQTPGTTEGYEGFYHLCSIQATVEEATLSYIIRDHNREIFEQRKEFIKEKAREMNEKYGEGTVTPILKDQYYNMLSQVEDKPHIIQIAQQAIEEACGHCTIVPIRGGTDGAQLSFKGLPCPNIFAGGLNFHGRNEFLPIQSMEKAMQTIVNICRLTAEM